MTISLALNHLFPGISFLPGTDCEIAEGQIVAWRRPEPQPTPEQIAAAMLPAARASVIARIRAERDRRELETGCPITFPGLEGVWRFHTDTLASRHLLQLFGIAARMRAAALGDDTPMPGAAFNPGFRTMGRDDRVPMTIRRVEMLEQAVMVKAGALHVAGAAHEAAVNALTDPAAVLGYDLSTGWPA